MHFDRKFSFQELLELAKQNLQIFQIFKFHLDHLDYEQTFKIILTDTAQNAAAPFSNFQID
jgi:hypothetical protein